MCKVQTTYHITNRNTDLFLLPPTKRVEQESYPLPPTKKRLRFLMTRIPARRDSGHQKCYGPLARELAAPRSAGEDAQDQQDRNQHPEAEVEILFQEGTVNEALAESGQHGTANTQNQPLNRAYKYQKGLPHLAYTTHNARHHPQK